VGFGRSSGQYLFAANVETEGVVEFKIDRTTGHLTMTGTILQIPFPEAIKFAPAAFAFDRCCVTACWRARLRKTYRER
jgi:hypothetical protein